MKVAAAVRLKDRFPVMPSWIRVMSDVMRVVNSPAPRVSKKAMF